MEQQVTIRSHRQKRLMVLVRCCQVFRHPSFSTNNHGHGFRPGSDRTDNNQAWMLTLRGSCSCPRKTLSSLLATVAQVSPECLREV